MDMYDSVQSSALIDKLVGTCVRCGSRGLKKYMTAVLFRHTAYHNPKTVCHLCEACATEICDRYELQM